VLICGGINSHEMKSSSPVFQLFILLILVTCSMLVFTFLAILISMPVYGFSSLSEVISSMDVSQQDNLSLLRFFQVFNHIGIFLLPALLYVVYFNYPILNFFKLNKPPLILSAFMVLILLISVVPILDVITTFNEKLELPQAFGKIELWLRQSEQNALELTERFLNVYTVYDLMFNIFMIALLPALGEELIFRGIIQKIFTDWIKGSPFIAIFITSVLFSALHMQFYSLLPRLLLGIVLGYLMYWSGTLWLPVAAHFINNFMAVMVYYLTANQIISMDPDHISTYLGLWGIIASMAISILLFVFIRDYERKKASVPGQQALV